MSTPTSTTSTTLTPNPAKEASMTSTTPAFIPNVTTEHPDDGTEYVIRLTGFEACEYSEQMGEPLHKYADPTEGAREDLFEEDAAIILKADPSLLYCDADARLVAVAKYLDNAFSEVEPTSGEDFTYDTAGRQTYRVFTDEEATTYAKERMEESAWAFNADFLARFIPALRSPRAAKAWTRMVGDLCEDANDLVLGLLGDKKDACFEEALEEDGRGHFIADYDGEEQEQEVGGKLFFLYRVN